MSLPQPQSPASTANSGNAAPEKYLIAFVIQGDDVFKITADNIVHTTGTANGPAFDAIAKLKAAAALLELTNRHKERPDELRQMARELAGEGMKLMARASSAIRQVPPPVIPAETVDTANEAAFTAPVDAAPAVPSPQLVAAASAPAPVAAIPPAPPQFASVRVQPPAPVPVPKQQDRSDTVELPGNPKIALISG